MRHAFALLALLLFASACDSGDALPARGEFEARLTGDVSLSLTGSARFRTNAVEGGEALTTIAMTENRVSPRGLSLIGSPELFEQAGTVDLGDAGGAALIYTAAESGQVTVLFSTSGTLTITSADSEQITGSFTADLADDPTSAPATSAQIEGSFEALGF